MAIIKSGASSDQLTIGPTSKAARAELYDAAGNPLAILDRASAGITPGTSRGVTVLGGDYKTGRIVRVSSDGALVEPNPLLHLFDNLEGSTQNTQAWTVTTLTMTFAQASGTLTFNSGSSVTSGQGAMIAGNKYVHLQTRTRAIFRSRQRHTAHFNNTVIELGFANSSSATQTFTSGGNSAICWRKDGTGQYIPVVAIAGSEYYGTAISNATFTALVPATDFCTFEIEVVFDGAWFRIITATGLLVNEQRVDFPPNSSGGYVGVTHLIPMIRLFNSGAVSTAVQVIMGPTAVWSLDQGHMKDWSHQIVGASFGWASSPTAQSQTPNYTNSTAPTTRTPSNTAAGETTLGGHVSWNNAGTSFAASDALDLILFGFQTPTPYGLYLTGSRISTVNLGAANGAAIYTIEYFLAINANALSLATSGTVAPRFIPLGFQTLANAAAIGSPFNQDTVWTPGAPVYIAPGRYVVLGARVIGASIATASQVIRTIWTPEGYFE